MQSPEFRATTNIVNALLINGDVYEDNAELIDRAIAIRDEIVEKVGG